MKSFHVSALREIKHIQANYATHWQRSLSVKPSAGPVSQLPLETEASLENCKVKSEPWHSHAWEGRHFLGLLSLSFSHSLYACCLCPVGF